MSGINFESLFDIDNLGDLVSDGIGAFKRTINDLFDGNGFGGADTFKAVVISNPVLITVQEASALGYDTQDGPASRDYRKFKVRIVNKTGNPHAILSDPCDNSIETESCIQNSLIAAHTTIVTHNHDGLQIGSYIDVRLDKNANKTYNLHNGHFVSSMGNNTTGQIILSREACDKLEVIFENGENYIPPETIELPGEIRDLSRQYDSDPNIPGKSQHKQFLDAESGKMPAVNAPFDMWFKAFIAKVYNVLGSEWEIEITSGFRTVEDQEEKHQKYLARKRANPNDSSQWGLPAACGLCSSHIGGAAIDINVHYSGTEYFLKGKGQQDAAGVRKWEDSGIPNIWKSLGSPAQMIWGGDFPNPDPIHFEYVPFQDFKSFVEQQGGRRTVYDTAKVGGATKKEMEGFDSRNKDDSETGKGDPIDEQIEQMINAGMPRLLAQLLGNKMRKAEERERARE